jgi:hypothetical protein
MIRTFSSAVGVAMRVATTAGPCFLLVAPQTASRSKPALDRFVAAGR